MHLSGIVVAQSYATYLISNEYKNLHVLAGVWQSVLILLYFTMVHARTDIMSIGNT